MGYINKITITGDSTHLIEPTLYISATSTAASGNTPQNYSATLTGFEYVTGAQIIVKFTETNTANATLKINSAAAKPMYYNESKLTANLLKASHLYSFIYDGSINSNEGGWRLVGDIDTDTDTKPYGVRVYKDTVNSSNFNTNYPLLIGRTAIASISWNSSNYVNNMYATINSDSTKAITYNPYLQTLNIGGLAIQATSNSGYYVDTAVNSVARKISLHVGSTSGDMGLCDDGNSSWIIKKDTNGKIYVNGIEFPTTAKLTDTWNALSTSQAGYVAQAPNDTTKFLRGDASWATLPTASTSAAGIIQIGTGATNAAAGNHNHDTVYSAIHQTSWTWASDGTQPLSKYVTFDANIAAGNTAKAPDAGWYNGFVSSHGNYLGSFILNKHRTANWYVGWEQYPKDDLSYTEPTWYLLAHSGNVETGANNGQIKIAGVNVSVKGLAALAYKDSLAASDIPDISNTYLPLTGGKMTGRIYREGTASNWHKGRDNALVAISTKSGYSPLASMKTTNGSWEIGTYDNTSFTDDLLFTYITDTLYNGSTATTSAQLRFYETGGALFTGQTTINYTTPASSAKGSSQLQVCDSSTSAPIAAIELRRGAINNQNGKASWQIINDRALRFVVDHNDNATAQQETYNNTILKLDYNNPIGITVHGGGNFSDTVTATNGFIGNLTGNASTATAATAINFTASNELIFGNADGQAKIYINHRRVINGQASGNTAITDYYFRNGNASENGVTIHAASFSGNAATATTATKANLLAASAADNTAGLQYYQGQPTIGSADGNAYEGSSNNRKLWSYPADYTTHNTKANIQTIRMYWGDAYWHDIFASPNNENLLHRSVLSGSAKNWRVILDSSNYSSYALPLSGGTMTGQITHAGVGSNWKGGRTNARLCMTAPIENNAENWGTWTPYISMRTVDGSWDLGAHKVSSTNANDLTFNFLTNTVANGTNASGPQVHFRPDITNNKVTIVADTFSGNATTATTATSASALTATKQNSANLNDETFKTQNLKIWYASGSNTITNQPTGFTSAEGAGWFTYRVADGYYGQLFHSHTNHLYIRTTGSSWEEISTKQYVDSQISAGFAANDAMVYKGILNKDATETATTLKNVPASGYSAGWTYKVAVAGTYANVSCEVGDMVIAVTDAAANQSTVNNNHWTVVQANLVGAVVADSGESGYIAKFSGPNTITKGPKIGTSTTKWLNETGAWSTPTAANVGASASDHTHGNITNGGGMTATGVALANGDTLLFVDNSDTNKLIKQTSIAFDGSTTTQALSKKGSWESTVNVNIAADDTSSTDNYPIVYATGKVATTTAQNSGLKKTTTKLYFQPSTGTLTATKFSGELSGNASSASKVSATLVTNKKIYFLGTETAITSTAANVSLEGDTGVYMTTTAGELSAVRHSYNVNGTEKAYTTYNTTDDSIDFIFI